MKTNKLVAGALTAFALLAVTATMLLAAPSKPQDTANTVNNAPIIPNQVIKAHSEEWNDRYFDKYTRTQPVLHIPSMPREKVRGGMAEEQSLNAVPKPRTAGVQAHSDAWNDYYFNRNVTDHLPTHETDYVNPLLWRGGLAKGANY